MADYNPGELNNGTTSSVDLTAGSTNTFTLTTEAVNSYFTLETTRNSSGKYDSNSPTNLSGSIENLVNVPSIIHDDGYIAGFVLGEGTSSFDFIPSADITGALFNLHAAGDIYLSLLSGGGVNPLWDGLLAYYTADNTPNDALGTYNGALTNGATYGTGLINNGFSLDGVNDYLEISPVIPYNSTSDSFSFSTWINPTQNGTIIDNMKNDLTGLNIWLGGGKVFVRIASGPYPTEIRTKTINTITFNNLYHIVVTYDGSTDSSGVNIYIDSSNQARSTQFNSCTSVSLNNDRTRLGSGYFGTTGGMMDEIGVWNRVISQSEVTELYNSGSGLQYS